MNSAAILPMALIVILSKVELGLGLECLVGLIDPTALQCPEITKNCMVATTSEFFFLFHLVVICHW